MPATDEQLRAFRGFLEISDHPDFVIKAGDFTWHVHSAVVSAQSKFFEKICHGEFKESFEGKVSLPEDCPWIVARMIQFFYFASFSYDHAIPDCSTGPTHYAHQTSCCVSSLDKLMQVGLSGDTYTELRSMDVQRSNREILALVYDIADRYDIPRLRSHAVNELLQQDVSTEEHFFEVVDIIGLSRLYLEHNLLDSLLTKIISTYCVTNTDDIPDFKAFVESNGRIGLLTTKIMQSRYHVLEEKKNHELAALRKLVKKRDATIAHFEDELERFETIAETREYNYFGSPGSSRHSSFSSSELY